MPPPRRAIVQLRAGSDGDASHVPKFGTYTQLDPPTLYLEKIGQQWLEARGEAHSGVKYVLASLPAGYTLWHRPRPKDPKHFDKYLYGHPGHKVFDSPNRFYPHFEHLMKNNGDSMGCPCTVCNGSSGVLPKSFSNSIEARRSSSASSGLSSRPSSSHGQMRPSTTPPAHQAHLIRPVSTVSGTAPVPPPVAVLKSAPLVQHHGYPKPLSIGMATTQVDEEGNPDVYRNLIDKLWRHGEIDEKFEEPMSQDWRAEQEIFPELLQKLKNNPQWIPRVGDVVLYVRELPDDVHIIRHPIAGDYRMYNESTKLWLSHPVWEAGLVGQTPAEPVTIEDVCENGNQKGNITYSGVRVEPLSDVNSSDKSLSKRHKYISTGHTRPFVLWKHLLHQVSEWHPTILNAQAVTSTLSLTGKYRFKGSWPDSSIYCRGMYIGHEMLAVGDAVRLLPNASHGQTTCTDILIIKSIRLKWSNLDKASENDWDGSRPYNSSVYVYGAAYTSDATRMNKEWFFNDHEQQRKAADNYGEWYPLHPPTKELAIPYSRILGRLYEREAMAHWLNTKSNNLPLLDAGREGLLESRIFSRQHDNRIARELDATWYWGDNRAQTLDLYTVNGLDVTAHDQERDPDEWRKRIKIMEGMANNKILPTAKPPLAPGFARCNPQDFVAPALSNRPVRSQPKRATHKASTSGSVMGFSSAGESWATGASRTRSHNVNLSPNEEEDKDYEVNEETQRTTEFVEDSSQLQKRRRALGSLSIEDI